jgi:hypothetical protein
MLALSALADNVNADGSVGMREHDIWNDHLPESQPTRDLQPSRTAVCPARPAKASARRLVERRG